jgi:hypothetical protein
MGNRAEKGAGMASNPTLEQRTCQCPNCGQEAVVGNAFCGHCAKPLNPLSPSSAGIKASSETSSTGELQSPVSAGPSNPNHSDAASSSFVSGSGGAPTMETTAHQISGEQVFLSPNHGGMRKRSTARLVGLAAAFVVLLAIIGAFWANDLAVRSSLSTTNQTLSNTESQLFNTESQLSNTETQLSSTKSQLQASEAKVNSLQSSLAGSQSAVSYAASVIGVLNTCLNGVDQTLSDDLAGDVLSGTVALESVEGVCQQAHSDINAIESAG